MKPIGYSIPWGNESKRAKVYKLTKQQTLFYARVRETKDRIEDLEKKLEGSQKTLEELQKACTHKVFNDDPGFDWSFRNCYLCGAYMGAG